MGIKKIQIEQSEIPKIAVGAGLSLQEWANLVHPQNDGYVTVATKNAAGEWTEKSYPSSIWIEKLVRHKDVSCYVSVNSFFIPKRNNSNARQINAFYVDIDYYNEFLGQNDVLSAIDFLVHTERLPEPSMIIDSGQGLYTYWLIESVPAKFKTVQKLYSHIEKYLIDVLKDLCSDPQASDIARVLKAPSTYHHETGKIVKILRYNEKRYTMRFMQQWFNDAEMTGYDADEIKNRKAKNKSRTKKVKPLFNDFTRAISRSEDLKMLCYLRNYELVGYRNTLLHMYTYQMFLIHGDYYVARSKAVELNDMLSEPLSRPDIIAITQSCQRAYKAHCENKKLGYNYSNSTMIKKLKITLEEQRHFQTIISKDVKYERNNAKRREARRKDGLTARERSKQEKIKQVKELHEKGLKQAEIALELNIDKGTVSKYLKLK